MKLTKKSQLRTGEKLLLAVLVNSKILLKVKTAGTCVKELWSYKFGALINSLRLFKPIPHFFLISKPSTFLILRLQGAVRKRRRHFFQSKESYSYGVLKLCYFCFSNNNK